MALQGRAVRFASFVFAVFAFLAASQAFAALTYSWTGAASNKWSNAGNWNPAGVPTDGDTLAFPSGAANTTNVNDLPAGTSFVTVGVLGYGYNLSGNGIVVTSSVSSVYNGTVFGLPIDFQANNATLSTNSSRFTGPISGSGTLTLSQSVQLEGAGTFSGTLTATNYVALTLANGASYPSMSVTGRIYVTGSGAIGPYSGTYQFHPTTIIETGNLVANAALGFTINGTTPGTGYTQAIVHGTVTAANGGSIYLSASSSFVPVVGQVFTLISNDGTDVTPAFIGTPEGATFSINGGTFRLSYVGGDGNDVTLTVTAAPRAWTGASSTLWSDPNNWSPVGVPQAGDRLLFPAGAANSASTNDISGLSVYSLTLTNGGLTLSGNTLAVTATVDGGTGSNNRIALPLDFGANNVNINGYASTPLRITGGISGTSSIAAYSNLQLEGTSTFSGTITSQYSMALANGASLASATLINNSTLSGAGAVGNLTSYTLQPSGILATRNLTQNSYFYVAVSGGTAGTGYPQVQATGTVTLGSSSVLSLSATSGFAPVAGQELVIIANDGTDAVTGQFSGLPEGSIVTLAGADYRLSYHGGDGNDVTLTCIVVPRIWTGASSALWSDAGNWNPNGTPQAGERLQFPSGVARTSTTNDLPAGTSFSQIVLSGSNYVLAGNGIVLTGGVSAPSPASGEVISLPLDFQANNVTFSGANGNRIRFTGGLAGTGTITVSTQVQVEGANTFSGTFTSTTGYGVYATPGSSMPSANFAGSAAFMGGNTSIGAFRSSSYFQHTGGTIATHDFAPASTFYTFINGAGAGTGYGQVQATGAVTIGSGAQLQVSLSTSFVPSIGAQYVLITNDGTDAIGGAFQGYPQGSTITLNGVYQFTVTYTGGDGNDFALVSLNGKPSSTTTVATSGSPANAATAVTFTATVSGAALPPTGTVTFYDGTSAIGTGTLSNGTATFTTTALAAGSHNISASYPGDSSYGGSASATLVQVIDKWASATAVSASANPTELGTTVTLTATVTSAGGTPTGTVHFLDGSVEIGTGSLSGGRATFATSSLALGNHVISANYDGSGVFVASSGAMSAALTVRDTTPPTVTITGKPAAVTNNTTATLTYTATDASGIATAKCTMDGVNTANCTSPFTANGLAAGPHTFTVTAVDNVGNGAAATYSFTVDLTPPTVALNGPFKIGQANAASYAITGTCSEQTNVRVVVPDISGFDYNVSCTSGAFTTGPANFTGLADGTHTVTATQLDVAGNSTTASSTIDKNVIAPTISINPPGTITSNNQATYPVGGNCSATGRTVTVQVASVQGTGTCDANSRSYNVFVDASSLSQGAVSIVASVSDTYGNTGSASATAMKDSIGPTLTLDALDTINNANKSTYTFTGKCETGGFDVTYTLASGTSITLSVPCTSGAFTVTRDVTSLADGTVSVQVVQRDSVGNTTTTTGSVTKDTANPTLAFDPPSVIGTSNAPSYNVTGTCSEAARTVSITVGSVSGTATCTSGGFSFTADVSAMPDGPVALAASMSDAAGNTATASATAQKSSAPQPPMVAGTKKVDLDGDGQGDLGFANASGQAGAWLMHGLTRMQANTVSGGTGAMMHALGDFDGDGRTDILWRMPDGSYRMTLMNGLTAGASSLVLGAGTGWEVVGTADFNGDGKSDLLWKHPTQGYGAWLMNGANAIAESSILSPGTDFAVQMLADFDGDRRTDVLWRHPDGRVKMTLMRGLDALPAADLTAATTWTPILAGDLDGDGKSDLLWSDADGSAAAWLMNGTAAKAYATLAGGGTGWSIAMVGDLDGDGREDLVWKRTDGSYAAWLMNGTTAKATGMLLDAGTGWSAVTLRDLDGDGRKDVLLVKTDGSIAGWLMNGLSITAGAVLMNGGTGWKLAP